MNNLKIKEVKNPEEWDRYVLGNKNSGYCHLFNWTRVIGDTYNHRFTYLAAVRSTSKKKEQICGILPFYLFKKMFCRPKLVSIPFFDTAGILAQDRKTQSFLIKNTTRFFVKNNISGMEIRQDASLDIPDMKILGVTPQIYRGKVGLHLNISTSQQKMMKSFKSKLRSQIQKGRKNSLSWKIGKRELLNPFFEVFSRNMRDLGSPVHSKKLFNAIFTHFYHNAFICVVYYRSRPVAASFMFKFKKKLSNPWASSIRKYRALNTNMFLYWQMIRFACNMGMETFDMGRSSKGASTYRFKKQWQPRETPHYWYQWKFAGTDKNMINETLSIDPWKKIPVRIAGFIGPHVRKNISL